MHCIGGATICGVYLKNVPFFYLPGGTGTVDIKGTCPRKLRPSPAQVLQTGGAKAGSYCRRHRKLPPTSPHDLTGSCVGRQRRLCVGGQRIMPVVRLRECASPPDLWRGGGDRRAKWCTLVICNWTGQMSCIHAIKNALASKRPHKGVNYAYDVLTRSVWWVKSVYNHRLHYMFTEKQFVQRVLIVLLFTDLGRRRDPGDSDRCEARRSVCRDADGSAGEICWLLNVVTQGVLN